MVLLPAYLLLLCLAKLIAECLFLPRCCVIYVMLSVTQVPEYLMHVDKRLNEENERLLHYLDSTTKWVDSVRLIGCIILHIHVNDDVFELERNMNRWMFWCNVGVSFIPHIKKMFIL